MDSLSLNIPLKQQKLIEEAKRNHDQRQKAAHQVQIQQMLSLQHHTENLTAGVANLQQLGGDLKKFIQEEKEKTPLEWTKDLGKFIENQSQRMGANETTTPGPEDEDAGYGEDSQQEIRKKIQGFGTDPEETPSLPKSSPRNSIRSSFFGGDDIPQPEDEIAPQNPGKGLFGGMPPLPLLNESITNILPGAHAKLDELNKLPVRMSGVLWKRRSGLGKHSQKAWEKRRVELRGAKLIYYQTVEEEDEEGRVSADAEIGKPQASPKGELIEKPDISTSTTPSSSKKLSIFEAAAQAAEASLAKAKDDFSKAANTFGIDTKPSANIPRGVLDLIEERASISPSMGHSGAPTPFCVSIKLNGGTKWKFCFESHLCMMQWVVALSDVVVKASVEVSNGFAMDEYSVTSGELGSKDRTSSAVISRAILQTKSNELVGDEETQWMLIDWKLQVAWGLVNVLLFLGRVLTLSNERYFELAVYLNFVIWQLCTRPTVSKLLRECESRRATSTSNIVPLERREKDDSSTRAMPKAGSSTVRVIQVDDPHIDETGATVPSWLGISSFGIDVRSHGYLKTRKKVSSPGELYECVAVDCFMSNSRISQVATQVQLPDANFDDEGVTKTWTSPDLFVVSISVPLEAPRLGSSSEDGYGMTFVGYFRMKKETRDILRRITAPGYNRANDASEDDVDVQKRIVNGVRLFEQYCKEAPTDPAFQARFKLIPFANLEEFGCPSYIAKYNGKPVLIKRNQTTGFLYDYPTLNTMEFDISLHPFPYLFKQAMNYIKGYVEKSIWTLGFVIEGRSDEELPEVAIGVMKVCYPSLSCGGLGGSSPEAS